MGTTPGQFTGTLGNFQFGVGLGRSLFPALSPPTTTARRRRSSNSPKEYVLPAKGVTPAAEAGPLGVAVKTPTEGG